MSFLTAQVRVKREVFFFVSFVLRFRNPSMPILGNGLHSRRQRLAVENRIRRVLRKGSINHTDSALLAW